MDLDYFLMHQLNNKFTNQPILIDRLIIANLSNHNPQDFFPGDWHGTKECYVLTPRRYLYGLVFRPDRRAGNGYWKGTTPGNVIFGKDGLVGVKKNLCFYEGDQSQHSGLQTNWKMIEYRLQHHICSIKCDHEHGRVDNWVLCKIYEDFGPEALFSQMERMNI
ncbi:NAC domain-containing protein 2-like [Rhododendron vialii]|uniref:NAC domain-containing protein 2-like n=1 Tax=Rhododendron vialii TaxID=182163 RepID=UPI00265F8B9F|nr:NAC domain-containing protein 2-like [Rhododendron vialii]